MPKTTEPTLRAVWLGQSLKALREAAKVTIRQVGEYVGKDPSSISRIECGEQPISQEALNEYMDFCGVTDAGRRAELTIIRHDVAQGGWWDGYRKDVAPTLMDRAWLESKATRIQSIETMVMPGLLQLPSYAQALMERVPTSKGPQETTRWIEVRMQRQHVITKHRPVMFDTLLDEQLLRRVAGDSSIQREQLDYLLEVSQRPNVSVRVIPGDLCTGAQGPFEIFTLAHPYPRIAYVATSVGDLCVESDALDELSAEYAWVESNALTPEESCELIRAERDKL